VQNLKQGACPNESSEEPGISPFKTLKGRRRKTAISRPRSSRDWWQLTDVSNGREGRPSPGADRRLAERVGCCRGSMIRTGVEPGRMREYSCPPTLQEAKPKAGTCPVATITTGADRRRERSPEVERHRTPDPLAFSGSIKYPTRRARSARRKSIGWSGVARTARGSGIAEMRPHPMREQTCEGPEPHERRRTMREGPLVRPGREGPSQARMSF